MDKRQKLRGDLEKIVTVNDNEPLSGHCTYRVGGRADLYVEVRDVEKLEAVLRAAIDSGVPYKLIGGGSNILVSDLGYRGLVIKNLSSRRTYIEQGRVRVDSGCSLNKLVHETAARGLSGLEWAVGIPGSLGGAITGNAGANGHSIADTLVSVTVLSGKEKRILIASSLGLAYRYSILKENPDVIVLSAELELGSDESEAIKDRLAEYGTLRKTRQPYGPSAGSVFKNPPDKPAGYLIEQTGLKGTTIGGAKVSNKHANFILNSGNATAQDIKTLIDFVIIKVKEEFDVSLELEIELVGEWNFVR